MLFIYLLLQLLPFNGPTATKAFNCPANETPIQTVRYFFWMATGFPGQEEYTCVTQGLASAEALLPITGFVGDIEAKRSWLSTMVTRKLGTSTTCATLPSSGSSVIGTGQTVYYETPQNTIPATFPGGGATYEKRLRYVNTVTGEETKFEFNCSNERIMANRTMTLTNGEFRVVTYYDNTSTTKYVDFYMQDDNNIIGSNLVIAVALRIDSTTETFQYWQVRAGYDPDDASCGVSCNFDAYRFNAHANYSSQVVSIHYQDISGGHYQLNNYLTFPDINSTSVSAVGHPPDGSGGGGSTEERQGCAADFSVESINITDDDTCGPAVNAAYPNLPLNAPPATAFGGIFSFQDVWQNLETQIVALP